MIPIHGNFCFTPHPENIDARGNLSFHNYKDKKKKKKKNPHFLPFLSAFQQWRLPCFVMNPFNYELRKAAYNEY